MRFLVIRRGGVRGGEGMGNNPLPHPSPGEAPSPLFPTYETPFGRWAWTAQKHKNTKHAKTRKIEIFEIHQNKLSEHHQNIHFTEISPENLGKPKGIFMFKPGRNSMLLMKIHEN